MRCNNACSWKGCRVYKRYGTIVTDLEFPRLFLCDKHLAIYNKLLKNNNQLSFGKIQLKRYIKKECL